MKRVVIAGGGISGLSTAYFLQEEAKNKGIELKYYLIEKGNRLGGNIVTEKEGSFIIEGGPDSFLTQKPWALQLCLKLGLAARLLNTNKDSQTFVLWKGKLYPLPDGFLLMIPTKIWPFLTNNLFTVRGKLAMAKDLIKLKGNPDKDESLADFVTRRLGKEALEKIAEPLVAGIHASEPETMSLKSSFPKFWELEQKYRSLILGMLKAQKVAKKAGGREKQQYSAFMSLKGGLIELVEAIVSKLDKESILMQTAITDIKRWGEGFSVEIEGGSSMKADSIILSTPARISAKLLGGLDGSIAGKLNEIPYVSTATVSLAFKKADLAEPLKGFGFVIPRAENRKIMAATYSSQKFAYRAPEDSVLIRVFVGGAQNEDLALLEDKEMVELVRSELGDILGLKAGPILAKTFRWPKAMPQYSIGHSQRIAWLDERLKEHPGLFLTGSAYKGTGISDSVHNAELTAKQVLDGLII